MARQPTSRDDKRSRRPRAPGERSRERVLQRAASLATVEGLERLSIGGLAAATGMPKSSVYVLFGSKEELQLATVEAARASFVREVIEPALAATRGRALLAALCEGFLSYVERRVFPGGCFFVAAAAELCGRSGRLQERVASYQQQWRDLLVRAARTAHKRGELSAGEDPDQVAFELGAILTGANIVSVLHSDESAIERARESVRRRLGGAPPTAPAVRPATET
jgi:AcrR family transcriptional regulator